MCEIIVAVGEDIEFGSVALDGGDRRGNRDGSESQEASDQ